MTDHYEGWTLWPEMADRIRKGARYQWVKQEVTGVMWRDGHGCRLDMNTTKGAHELRFDDEMAMLFHALELIAPLPQWRIMEQAQP